MQPEFDELCRRLVTDAADAIVYADHDGVIRYWNGAAERLFGFGSAEAVGRSLDIIIPERLRDRHWEGYRRTMATGTSRYQSGALLSVPAVKKDGSQISVEFTIVTVTGNDGRLLGIGAIMRDVTERFNELKELRRRAGGAARNS
jgi:PAS domain S-box-containing protein